MFKNKMLGKIFLLLFFVLIFLFLFYLAIQYLPFLFKKIEYEKNVKKVTKEGFPAREIIRMVEEDSENYPFVRIFVIDNYFAFVERYRFANDAEFSFLLIDKEKNIVCRHYATIFGPKLYCVDQKIKDEIFVKINTYKINLGLDNHKVELIYQKPIDKKLEKMFKEIYKIP